MKYSYVFALLAILIIAAGCSSDKSTGNGGGPPGDDFKLIASDSIGSAGGSIGNDDMALDIPAGTIDQTVQISLYTSSSEDPFGDNGVSNVFRLGGLPADFVGTVHARVKYNGTLNEESYIAIGEKFYDPVSDDSIVTYSLVDATDSSGYLVSDLVFDAGDDVMSASVDGGLDPATVVPFRFLIGATDMQTYGTSSFLIKYPRRLRENVIQLNSFFEGALLQMELLDFYDHQNTELIRYRVLVRDVGKRRYATFIPRPKYRYYTDPTKTTFVVNEADLGASYYPEMKADVGHEVFLLDAAMRNRVSAEKQPHSWFDYACATWCEEKYTDNAGTYVPPGVVENSSNVLSSFDVRSDADASQHWMHGQAMAPFIKYLVNRCGKSVVRETYTAKRLYYVDTRKALFGGYAGISDEPYTDWYPEFLKQLINEELYSKSGELSASILDEVYHEYAIDSDNHQIGSIPADYLDLTSKVFRFRLTNPNFEDGDQLVLSVQSDDLIAEYTHMIVFTRKGSTIQYVDDAVSVTVDNVYALSQAGYDVYVVVVNCRANLQDYTEESQINLQFEVIEPPDMNIVEALINVKFDIRFHNADGEQYTREGYILTWYAKGSTVGNTFTGTIDQFVNGYYPYGTMEITFDPLTYEVLSFGASATIDSDINGNEHWDINGSNVQGSYIVDGYVSCNAQGSAVCDAITGARYTWEREGYWYEMLYHECSVDSWIYINLYPEDYFK